MATTDEKQKTAPRTTRSPETESSPNILLGRNLDYVDLKPVWDRLIDKRRTDAESELLRITTRISKLDPIAEVALAKVKDNFATNEAALRQLISRHGWATELDRVNKRLNALRISDNKRVVLAEVYPAILNTLLQCGEADEAVKDEIGFTNDVIFELERENGPLDQFAQEIVKLVGAKHRINFTDDNVMLDLVSHQVRSGL